jgi:hypothetical protein
MQRCGQYYCMLYLLCCDLFCTSKHAQDKNNTEQCVYCVDSFSHQSVPKTWTCSHDYCILTLRFLSSHQVKVIVPDFGFPQH